MESKWFNSTIILIFSMGLVVGSLGCHLILSDSYRKTQEDMFESIEALNKTVQGILGNINSIALKVERLEGRASSLNTRVDLNEYSLEGVESDVEYIDHRIDLLEEKYDVLVEENEENLVQIREKDEHISHLYSELGVTDGCRLYLDHEVMFEYPEEMSVSEEGTRSRDASSLQGVVSGSLVVEERVEIMVTSWEYDVLDYYRENVLNELDDPALLAEYGFEDLQVGEVMETGHLGHVVYYRDFTAALYNETIHGRLGAWFCTQERRVHVLLVFVDDVDYESSFLSYLASFRCHK
jgi:uncharacterized protein YoxC